MALLMSLSVYDLPVCAVALVSKYIMDSNFDGLLTTALAAPRLPAADARRGGRNEEGSDKREGSGELHGGEVRLVKTGGGLPGQLAALSQSPFMRRAGAPSVLFVRYMPFLALRTWCRRTYRQTHVHRSTRSHVLLRE